MNDYENKKPPSSNGTRSTVLGRMSAWLGSAVRWNGRPAGPDPVVEVQAAVEALGARMAELRDQLEASRDAGDRTAKAIRDLHAAFDELPALYREQNATVARLAEGIDAARSRTGKLSSTIESLPRAMSAQADALQDLTQEVQRSNEADAEMRKTLASLSTAVERLAARTTEHDEIILRVDTHAGIRERTLSDIIDAQNKRFAGLMWLMVAALGVTLVMAFVQLALLTRN